MFKSKSSPKQFDADMRGLMHRLNKIEKELPADDGTVSTSSKGKSNFADIKSEIMGRLLKLKQDINAMDEKFINTRDKISRSTKARVEVKALTERCVDLAKAYEKEIKVWGRKKLSEEEKNERQDQLRIVQRELEHVSSQFSQSYTGTLGGGAPPPTFRTGGGFGAQMNDVLSSSNGGVSGGGGGGDASNPFGDSGGGGGGTSGFADLSQAHELELGNMKETDQMHEQMIGEIGQAVSVLAELAGTIKEGIDVQGKHLADLEKNIEATTEKVYDVNKDLKKQLEDKGAGVERFCMNFICIVVLLAVVGLILNTTM